MTCKEKLQEIQNHINECWKHIEKCDKGMVSPGIKSRKNLQKAADLCRDLKMKITALRGSDG